MPHPPCTERLAKAPPASEKQSSASRGLSLMRAGLAAMSLQGGCERRGAAPVAGAHVALAACMQPWCSHGTSHMGTCLWLGLPGPRVRRRQTGFPHAQLAAPAGAAGRPTWAGRLPPAAWHPARRGPPRWQTGAACGRSGCTPAAERTRSLRSGPWGRRLQGGPGVATVQGPAGSWHQRGGEPPPADLGQTLPGLKAQGSTCQCADAQAMAAVVAGRRPEWLPGH